jgi:arsenate reductase
MLRRLSAACLACLPIFAASAQRTAAASDTQTVAFVCEHGTVKSVLALALFQKLAREARIPYKAVSRGTAPDSVMPPFMRSGLAADGLTLNAFKPTAFSLEDVAAASLVVSFDNPGVAKVVGSTKPLAAWDGLPSVSANYVVARDSIKGRIARLVDSLARSRRR